MKIWLITIGEQLPIKKEIRKLRTAYLADELVSRGHSVVWWTSAFDHFKKEWIYDKDIEIPINDNYKILLLKGSGYKRNISIARFWDHRLIAKKFRARSRQKTKPDIIIVSMPTYDLALEATKIAKDFNIPVLIDIRDRWPDIFIDKSPLPKKLSRFLLNKEFNILKKALSNATGIISVSKTFFDWGLSHANRAKKNEDAIFYLGYKKNTAPSPRDDIAFLQLKNKFIITFIGTLEEFHDPSILLSCAKKLESIPDIHFVIAGDGKLKKEMDKEAAQLKNITLTGWLDQKQIDILLGESSIGVCTSRYKTDIFPNKVFSYFAFGLPVLSSFDGDLKEIIEKFNTGFNYPSSDYSALSNLIIEIKNSPELFNRLRENSINLFNDQLDGSTIYKNYADHIEKVANLEEQTSLY